MLKKGCVALKFGRQGKPHPATFKLSDDETTLSWEDGRGGLAGSFSNFAGKMANKKRSVQISDVASMLVGAESNVFKRSIEGDDGDVSLCLSLLIDSQDSGATASSRARASSTFTEKDSLDVRCSASPTAAPQALCTSARVCRPRCTSDCIHALGARQTSTRPPLQGSLGHR